MEKCLAPEPTPCLAHKGSDLDEEEEALLFDNETDWPVINDPMNYTTAWMKSWTTLCIFEKTIWQNPGLWKQMGNLMLLAWVVGVTSYCFMPDPEQLNVSKFDELARVITLFTTLMMSFFLSTAVTRWLSCVDGFVDLCNAIRNLSLQLHTLGVEHEQLRKCLRFGVLSAAYLIHELRTNKLPYAQQMQLTKRWWDQSERDDMSSLRYVKPGEREVLEPITDITAQMWIWIASIIGRMALDGEIPSLDSSTYGRIMQLAHVAQGGIRQVRTEQFIQTPFVYVHTLATLVHVNCILLAINLGVTCGATIHAIQLHSQQHSVEPLPGVSIIPLATQAQSFMVELLRGFFCPLLFQAFFEIGIALVSPFSDPYGAIPVDTMLKQLERDLDDSSALANNTPGWEAPVFKTEQ